MIQSKFMDEFHLHSLSNVGLTLIILKNLSHSLSLQWLGVMTSLSNN